MSEKWVKLTKKLIELTDQSNMDWKEYDDGDVIRTQLGGYILSIEYVSHFTQYRFVVKDSSGKIVDEFSDDDLTSLGFMDAFGKLKRLFRHVNRLNSGAENALDQLLNELDKKDEIPF